MKTKRQTVKVIALAIAITGQATVTSVSGPVVTVQVPAPVVTVQAPAPAITITMVVPDTYVWDGFEFVGVVGNQCLYLGDGGYWLPCDTLRLRRFHTWEKANADWRAHAIENVRYRVDARGHIHPWHGDKHSDRDDHGHDRDH